MSGQVQHAEGRRARPSPAGPWRSSRPRKAARISRWRSTTPMTTATSSRSPATTADRPEANLYELPIDRMLLKSKDRPKADGLPVPFVESTAGLCKQVGNFVTLEAFLHLLHRDGQERQEIRVAVRIRRRADGGAPHQAAAGRKSRGVAVRLAKMTRRLFSATAEGRPQASSFGKTVVDVSNSMAHLGFSSSAPGTLIWTPTPSLTA